MYILEPKVIAEEQNDTRATEQNEEPETDLDFESDLEIFDDSL